MKNKYNPKSVTHPGATLMERLNELGFTLDYVVEQTGIPKDEFMSIINERSLIKEDQIEAIAKLTKIPSMFWFARQKRYIKTMIKFESIALDKAKDMSLPLKDRRLAFLEWMAEHYTSDNRGVSEDGSCMYSAGCAIGIHLDPDIAKEMNEIGDWGEFVSFIRDILHVDYLQDSDKVILALYKQIPDWLTTLDGDDIGSFLDQCQMLHDNGKAWNIKGLSSEGKERSYKIKKSFGLEDPK